MQFSNKVYDVLKFVAQIFLPALGTLYAALSGYWKWPNTEEVVGTIIAVDAFLGVLLGLSSRSYGKNPVTDGAFVLTEVNGEKKISLDLEDNPEALGTKDVITFRNLVREHVVDE